MSLPANFAGFTLYRIYYGDCLVYIGRTTQPLQNRIRGHLFKKPMHREIDINQVTKIEFAQFETVADMYVYEIYFINLWKPPLNVDDKAYDYLTVKLADVEWKPFETHLWEKWKREIAEIDKREEESRRAKLEAREFQRAMRQKWHAGEITEKEYYKAIENHHDLW